MLPWETFSRAVEDLLTLARPGSQDALAFLGLHYTTVGRYAPRLLGSFVFTGATSSRTPLRAVVILRELNASEKRTIPPGAPIDFIGSRWAAFVFDGEKLDRRYYELCVLSELRQRLQSGDVWVVGSRKYRDFDAPIPSRWTGGARRQGRRPCLSA